MPWVLTETAYRGGRWVTKHVDRKPFLKKSWDTRAEALSAARELNRGK